MTDAEIVDELAKSLAEYDGHVIVTTGHEFMVGAWEPRRLEGQGTESTQEAYMREARRFLHCFRAVSYLLKGYVPEEYGHG